MRERSKRGGRERGGRERDNRENTKQFVRVINKSRMVSQNCAYTTERAADRLAWRVIWLAAGWGGGGTGSAGVASPSAGGGAPTVGT